MKVLLLNGSAHVNGTTKRALKEIEKTLNEDGIETEIIEVGSANILGCLGCNYCKKTGKCVRNDLVNEVNKKFKDADGLIAATPVYYSTPSGSILSFLDRLFYSKDFDTTMKVGASVACARRSGTTQTLDCLTKYFTISNMPVAPSTYWNNVYGLNALDAESDLEGLQTMRNLAHNVAYMVKAINAYKKENGLPLTEKGSHTNFIR